MFCPSLSSFDVLSQNGKTQAKDHKPKGKRPKTQKAKDGKRQKTQKEKDGKDKRSKDDKEGKTQKTVPSSPQHLYLFHSERHARDLGSIPDPVTEDTLVYCPFRGSILACDSRFVRDPGRRRRPGPRRNNESQPKIDPRTGNIRGYPLLLGRGCTQEKSV